MTSQYIKSRVPILFLTLILAPLVSSIDPAQPTDPVQATDPAQATDPVQAQPQATDPVQAQPEPTDPVQAQPEATDPVQAQKPEDATVMEKLSPFDKMVVYNLKNTDGLSPEETVAQAEFIYKMKTGAPLNPEEQEMADQMSPLDREVLQKELPKYNDVPPEGLQGALTQLQNDLRPKVEAEQAALQAAAAAQQQPQVPQQ